MKKHRLFGAALLAAPLFWGALLLSGNAAIDTAWPLRAPGRFIVLSLAYPIIEELAFRGFLQGYIYNTSWGMRTRRGISVANAFTSIIFAVAHLFRHTFLWASLTFFPSLVFGFFRDRYGRLLPPIILHIVYNAGYFWLFGAPGDSVAAPVLVNP